MINVENLLIDVQNLLINVQNLLTNNGTFRIFVKPSSGSGAEYCAPGATCEFFLTCWLGGGLLEGPCDGILRGCCQRAATKTGGQGQSQAVGTMEAPPETAKAQVGLLDQDVSRKSSMS